MNSFWIPEQESGYGTGKSGSGNCDNDHKAKVVVERGTITSPTGIYMDMKAQKLIESRNSEVSQGQTVRYALK